MRINLDNLIVLFLACIAGYAFLASLETILSVKFPFYVFLLFNVAVTLSGRKIIEREKK